jgi:hypothetical protein
MYGSGVPAAISGYFFRLASNSPTAAVNPDFAVAEVVHQDENDVGLRRRPLLRLRNAHRRGGTERGRRSERHAAEQDAAAVKRAICGFDFRLRPSIGIVLTTCSSMLSYGRELSQNGLT